MDKRPITKRAEGIRHLNYGPNPNSIMIPAHTRVAKYVRPHAETAPIYLAKLTPRQQKAVNRFAPRLNGAPLPRGKVVK